MKHERLTVDPKILLGKPVIQETRIPVERILRKLAEGMTEDQILEHHPQLTREDIRAAEAFAADHLAHEEIVIASGETLGIALPTNAVTRFWGTDGPATDMTFWT